MNRCAIVVATILLVALGGASVEANGSLFGGSVGKICSTNSNVKITKASELSALAVALGGSESDCSQEVRESIVELNNIIGQQSEETICTQEHANRLQDYNLKYLVNSESPKSKLVRQLRKLFIAYGLRVSYICRHTLLSALARDTRDLLESEDLAEIGRWTSRESVIAKLLSEPDDFENLVLPKSFGKMLGATVRQTNNEDEKVFIQSATDGLVKHLQDICGRHLKPIYSRLVLPLVTLANTGFNYRGSDYELEDQSRLNRETYQWFRVVFVCEFALGVRMVETRHNAELGDASDRKLIKVLTKEEAAKLISENPTAVITSDDETKLQPIEYNAVIRASELPPDQLVSLDDKSLTKAIKKFKVRKNVFKSKFWQKSLGLIKEKLAKGAVRVATKMGNQRGPEFSGSDLVKFIDDYMDQLGKQSESAVSAEYRLFGKTFKNRHIVRYLWVPVVAAIIIAFIVKVVF